MIDVLLNRLDRVRKHGDGYRARCPACGGHSDRDKLSMSERDGKVLLYCFGGCRGDAVLAAVGLRWADIMPPRDRPLTPRERDEIRRAARQAGWSIALDALAIEAKVVLVAARELQAGRALPTEDLARLQEAIAWIDASATLLSDAPAWRPEYMTPVKAAA
ncbi:MAG: hypothetical protein MK141_01815 [Pseudoxanthomonas sp.]|uniref:hypothetical protein n=1 Tax=Pseudoxanthomonas sp. TaxID=1871049 RepID=UPI002582CDAA|nr:hypothetical protein [Pseudoxanthomonas sp.]MCH2090302.1 hypothetical protein [Pseudoxanthomonas sp.]